MCNGWKAKCSLVAHSFALGRYKWMWVLSTAIDMFITIWQTFNSTMFALWSEIENIDMHWCEVNYRINYKHNKFPGKRILKTGVIKNSSQFKWNAIILSKTSCWKVSLSFLSSLNVFRYGRMGQAIILQRILLQWVQFSVKELNCIRSALDKHLHCPWTVFWAVWTRHSGSLVQGLQWLL